MLLRFVQAGMGEGERGIPFGGERGVPGAALGHGRAMEAETSCRLARIAGAAQRGEEGLVLVRLAPVEGAGAGHRTVFRNQFQHCKAQMAVAAHMRSALGP
ncbi:hypothetical protein ABS767_10405 [Sphingomonas sp. ST-64]|uniref:Uncharacterized protein n=1 Tax=Sphingomonas plantiphila TaxID=3163295 RepID=A0ABW8YN85_9SPHN